MQEPSIAHIDRKTTVWITTSFIGWHRWKNAPLISQQYLKEYHRHVFHVKLGVLVEASRQVEFIELKDYINEYIKQAWSNQYFDDSCEVIAHRLFGMFDAEFVEVSEDGENGARVEKQKDPA